MRNKSLGEEARLLLPTILVGGILAYLVVVPLLAVAVSSFSPSGFPSEPGLTLNNYRAVYGDETFYSLLFNTAVFTTGSTAVALVLGVALAYLLERTNVPGRRTLRALIVLPMAMPPLLMAIGWATLLSPRVGSINLFIMELFGLDQAPFNVYSLGGMIFVEGIALVPTAFLLLAPAFRNIDPNFEDAAMASGAKLLTIVRLIYLPLLLPSILAASLLLFIVGFVVFDVPGTLGMPVRIYVLSTQIYRYAYDSPSGVPLYGHISALAVFFLILLMSFGALYHRMTRHAQRYRTVTGKGFRPRTAALGWWRWLAFAVILAYFVVAVLLPVANLVWMSLMPYQRGFSLAALNFITLDNHRAFLENQRVIQSIQNSLIIAVAAATAVALLALVVSWLTIRLRAPGSKVIDFLAFAPIALPGVLLGVAVIYVYLTASSIIPIYGTIWIIAVAYVTHYISFGSRATNNVMIQLHPELEEAGRTSGASGLFVLRRITFPLVQAAVIAVWIWVLAHCLRELSTALMLQGRHNTVVPTLLWDYWSAGQQPEAAAIGVWLVVASMLFLAGWQFIASRAGVRETS